MFFILHLPQVTTPTKPLCVWHAFSCTYHYLKLCVATPELGQSFPMLNIVDVTQVVITLVPHTLGAKISCLHASPHLAIGKKLFNESQPHIILHPFYIQHCVGKT
jgi:hypothetical protein